MKLTLSRIKLTLSRIKKAQSVKKKKSNHTYPSTVNVVSMKGQHFVYGLDDTRLHHYRTSTWKTQGATVKEQKTTSFAQHYVILKSERMDDLGKALLGTSFH